MPAQDAFIKPNFRPAARPLLLALCLLAIPAACISQTQGEREPVVSYSGIGRIQWRMPPDFSYIFAVPHFTAGRRIMCAAAKKWECVVEVHERSYSREPGEYRKELAENAQAAAKEAGIAVPPVQTFGDSPAVQYVKLADPRPGQPYRFMIVGYALNGPAYLRFEMVSNDEPMLQSILKVVQQAKVADALPVLAMRLDASRITCNERYAEYAAANNAAFRASPFGPVDVAATLRGGGTTEDARAKLDGLRQDYAKDFDKDPEPERRAFCKGLPALIGKAAGSLPRP